MRALPGLWLTTLLLAVANQAAAASSVDLTVKGLITPSACTPSLSNGGSVEYGKISAKDLNPIYATFLEQQTLRLNVTCDAMTLMALESKDNREGSDYMNDTLEFGLGLINGDEKLGAMMLRLVYPVADGVPVRTISSEDGGNTWWSDRYLMRNNLLSVADTATLAPIPIQDFSADFVVTPKIAPANRLTLTNEVPIDGSVTLTVRYL